MADVGGLDRFLRLLSPEQAQRPGDGGVAGGDDRPFTSAKTASRSVVAAYPTAATPTMANAISRRPPGSKCLTDSEVELPPILALYRVQGVSHVETERTHGGLDADTAAHSRLNAAPPRSLTSGVTAPLSTKTTPTTTARWGSGSPR